MHHYRGLKQYELDNHLGNVLSVIADTKIERTDSTFEPEVLSLQRSFHDDFMEIPTIQRRVKK